MRALDGVTVEFPQGQFTAIMGPSGSGKSTLLQSRSSWAAVQDPAGNLIELFQPAGR